MSQVSIPGFLIVLLSGMLMVPVVFAVDGDVDYAAPYLWVDPETGQVSTINPGPQPKVHTETADNSRTPAEKPDMTGTDDSGQQSSATDEK
jgi:hypothetical protein